MLWGVRWSGNGVIRCRDIPIMLVNQLLAIFHSLEDDNHSHLYGC